MFAAVAALMAPALAGAERPSQTSAASAPATTAPVADPLFAEPYIDVDEWREAPVRHRYVHGGFKGTDTRFSIYFPPKRQYQGRFFQHITPVPDDENLAQKKPPGEHNKIGFAIASGAYFLETNGGGKTDPSRGTRAPPSCEQGGAEARPLEPPRAVRE